MKLLTSLNDFLWNSPLLFLLMGTHLFFTLKLHFPQRHIGKALRLSVTPEKQQGQASPNLSAFGALATTLAATLGTGNIVGVSTAVALGGPGAVFWCWLTGILGMATSYAECYLSVLFREKNKDNLYVGGPKMKKLLFLTIFLAIPAQTFASGCDCGTINGMLTMNRGQTVQMVNAHTTAEGEAIRSEILLAAQNIIGTMKAESATIVRAIVALKESNAANMKGQAIAGQTMKNMFEYAGHGYI